MIRSFVTVSIGTLSSRLLGFARDAMLAALLGTGPVADAFLIAFQLVNVVRRLLAEGAMNAALVPAWLRVRQAGGPHAAAAFAGRVLATVAAALIAASILIGFLMPWIVAVWAPGFGGHEMLQMAISDARLMLPYLAFAGPVTILMGLLNAQYRFALGALSPLLFNVSLIAVMAVLLSLRQNANSAALIMAATVGAAGLLQLSVLLLRRTGRLATPLRVSMDHEMRVFFCRAIPGMVASSGPQLLILAGAIIASSSPSAVAWLYFANRLIELPLGIVGVGMGTVLLPELTRELHAGERGDALAHAQSRSLELAIGLALPATLGLMLLNQPIVRMLFEHGLFTAADGAATAEALILLALGLPAHVAAKALSPAFFAREDTLTPLGATMAGLGIALLVSLWLKQAIGANGIAAGLTLGAWSSALVLIGRGATTFGFSIDAAARRRLPRIVAASLLLATFLWAGADLMLDSAAKTLGLAQAVLLLVLIATGMALYAVLLAAFGVVKASETVQVLRQVKPPDLHD